MKGNAPPVLRRLQLFDGNVHTLIGRGRATFEVHCFSRIVAFATSAGSCLLHCCLQHRLQQRRTPRQTCDIDERESKRQILLADRL